MEEQSPCFYLLDIDTHHEIQVHTCAYDFSTDNFRISLGVVECLP